jgi:hypothetical protein
MAQLRAFVTQRFIRCRGALSSHALDKFQPRNNVSLIGFRMGASRRGESWGVWAKTRKARLELTR